MENLKLWILAVCVTSLITVILKSVLPDGSVAKTFNIVAAIAIVVAVVTPLRKLNFNLFEMALNNNAAAVEEKIKDAAKGNDEIIDSIIETKLCEYICNKTGLDKKHISITCEKGEVSQVVLNTDNAQVLQIVIDDCGIDEDKIKLGE